MHVSKIIADAFANWPQLLGYAAALCTLVVTLQAALAKAKCAAEPEASS